MNSQEIIAILPMILITASAVVMMMVISVRRSHLLICTIACAGILIALFSSFAVIPLLPLQVTPLLIMDQYSLFFIDLILLTALAITVFSYPYFRNLSDAKDEFYLLLIIAVLGSMVMVSSNHFITAFLGLETLSVSLYGMVAYPLHARTTAKHPIEASVKYLVLSAVASAFILFGIALVYSQIGTLAFADISEKMQLLDGQQTASSATMLLAVSMLTVGIAFKLSLAPFHIWTPDVYEGAPLPATALLATIGKVAMFIVLLRYFSMAGAFNSETVITIFSFLAIASIITGNLLALLQNSIKRILAYSSIAHMGYLLIGFIVAGKSADSLGVESITYYLVAYVVMSLGAFGVVMMLSNSEQETDSVDQYRGLFWRNPWLATVFTAMLISLAGIPLTIGFIGKFYIFLSAVEGELWVLLLTLVVGSGIGLFYYLRIVYQMLLSDESTGDAVSESAGGFGSHTVLASLLFLLILLGVYPAGLMALIELVAQSI